MTTRLRTNFIQGKITDAPLLIGATAINAPEFADLPVVVAPDFLVVELDPLRQFGTPEIVYVTAHAAAATTVTVLRGQEGTNARQHAATTRFVHGASSGDFWGGGQQWYGAQAINGPIALTNDQNMIPLSAAIQDAGVVVCFEPATVNNTLTYLSNGGASVYAPGEGAIELKATSGTDPLMYYNQPTRETAFPVVPLRRYWAMGRARPTGASPARQVRCYINFYNSSGTLLTPNSSTDTLEVTGGAWVISTHAATAPATAAYATIAFTPVGAATNETHAFTAFGFGAGTAPPAAFLPAVGLRMSSTQKRDTEYGDNDLLSIEVSGFGDLENRFVRYSDVFWSKIYWAFRRARGTKAAPTNVAAGDWIGGIRSGAYRDGEWRGVGDIAYLVDTVGTGQVSGRLLLMANNLGGSGSYGWDVLGSSGTIRATAVSVYGRLLGGSYDTIGLQVDQARVYARGDQNGMAAYDAAGNIRYLFGLRSDVTGNTTDAVWYSYGGALRIMVGGTEIIRADPSGYPWLRPAAWNAPTLGNSWVNYGNGWQSARYCKTAEGLVHIEGLIAGGTMTGGTVLFTLPTGFRPAGSHMFVCQSSSGGQRIDVNPDGNVVLQGAFISGGNNGYLQLDGIVFSVV